MTGERFSSDSEPHIECESSVERVAAGYPYSAEGTRATIDMLKEWIKKLGRKVDNA